MTIRQRYQVFDVLTAAGVPIDAPTMTDLNLGDCILNRVDLRIPPGPCGLCGVSIQQAGTQIWPWGDLGTWIVGDDEQYSIDVNAEIDNGVEFVTYNLDVYPHTLYFKMFFTPITLTIAVSAGANIIPITA